MADFREPPPLFNDDREDENDDLFSSAVQSPVSDKTATPEDQRPSEDPLTPHNSTASLTPADTPDLFESAQGPIAEGGGPDLPPASDGGDDKHQEEEKEAPSAPVEVLLDIPDSPSAPSDPVEEVGEGIDTPNHILTPEPAPTSTPTPDSDPDPALVHDPAPASFLGDGDTMEISLDDGKTKDTSEPPLPPSSILPPMGAPLTPPVVPVTPTATPSLTPNITPAAPTPVTPVAMPRTTPEQPQAEGDGTEEYIQITVSDPQKIGEGMSSYMAYKVTTKTNVSYFRKKHWSVMRRFSDFLGLHRKLVEKHLHSGRIIPPAPEKSAIGTTKIKLGSDKNADPGSAEFIERRRASLERYMNRTGAHPTLRADPDFREFIELDAELPRATQTSALSSAGVLRLFNRVGETVNKMTFKMDESDQWFEEKTQQIESLDAQLRKLHAAMEGLVSYRRELAISTASFAKATAVLSSVEEHSSLSRALHQLSESTERTHTIHHAQADADFYVLSENTKDYIHLIQSVKDVFHERVKTFQTWQHAQITLAKKREAKAKAELAGRMDKVQQAQEEVAEWEGKVERSQEEFERISRAIKKEMEQFDVMRLKDFRDMVVKYLEDLMTSQQQIIKVWETFIPEAKAIS
ncbi:sorting nexin-2-like isoform X2 [Eriocheir sinensis]|uniref:sorting nexin-2-like isoform X2 n=1 Tax=Eriocheir sinensis TaxID=95602 RepID=UPI0021C84331|nr:sorting nexin-2-like isoform X2 [Eriocheir sinensis]